MDKFSIQSDISGEIAVITASGRFDSETAPNLDAELSKVVGEKNKIVLNLQGVDYMSSAGLRAMVKAFQQAQKSGGDVRLAAVSRPIEVILRTVGMLQMFKLYTTNEEALANF
jgi:anti-sigma B factor antagonist